MKYQFNKIANLLGKTVYHKDLYDYKEPFVVTGITIDKIELEGDYSGGTHNIIQKDWLPLEGTSTIYNYGYKQKCRKTALTIQTLSIPLESKPSKSNIEETLIELTNMVLTLTNDIHLNKQF